MCFCSSYSTALWLMRAHPSGSCRARTVEFGRRSFDFNGHCFLTGLWRLPDNDWHLSCRQLRCMGQLWGLLWLLLTADFFVPQVRLNLLPHAFTLRNIELFFVAVLSIAAPAAHQSQRIHEIEHGLGEGQQFPRRSGPVAGSQICGEFSRFNVWVSLGSDNSSY